MGDDRETAERWRVKFLKRDPVADHVLDIVCHHREQKRPEEYPEAWQAKGVERAASEVLHERAKLPRSAECVARFIAKCECASNLMPHIPGVQRALQGLNYAHNEVPP